MIQQVFKLDPGVCTCHLGDPVAGAMSVNIRRLSGSEAILDPIAGLRENQYLYLTLKFLDGPSLSLSGIVVTSVAEGIFVQWSHARPSDADRVDKTIREYLKGREVQASQEAPPVPAGQAPAPAAPAAAHGIEAAAPTGGSTRAPPVPIAPQAAPLEPRPRGAAPGGSARVPLTPKVEAPAAPSPPAGPSSPAAASPLQAAAPAPAALAAAKPAAAPQGSTAKRKAAAGSLRIQRKEGGELDVSASIRERSKVVRSSELASRHDLVRVLNFETIHGLILEAVNESAALVNSRMGDEERQRLLKEAEASFQERLATFKAEKAGMEEKTRLLQSQLDKASQLLDEERARILSANQFTVSSEGMIVLEQRLGRLIDHAVKAGDLKPEVIAEMRAVVAALLDEERDKIRVQAEKAQSETIDLLEKKVKRLASSLDEAAKERDQARRRAQALEASGVGPAHNVREAGLAEDDPDRSKKLDLLKEIFKLNQEVRQQLAERGVVIQGRVRPAAPAAQPQAAPASGAAAPPQAEAAPQTAAASQPDAAARGTPAPAGSAPQASPSSAPAAAPPGKAARGKRPAGRAGALPAEPAAPLEPQMPACVSDARKVEQEIAAALGIQRKEPPRQELKTERIEPKAVGDALAAQILGEAPASGTSEDEAPATDAADPDAIWEPPPEAASGVAGGPRKKVRRLG